MTTLSIGIVTYRPDFRTLSQTIDTLNTCINNSRKAGSLTDACLIIVDNSTCKAVYNKIEQMLELAQNHYQITTRLLATPRNLGYGTAQNLALEISTTDYHLVLNPDVLLDENSLQNAVEFMQQHGDVALLTPNGRNEQGNKEYLNKRYPDLITLLLRGFAPQALKNRFRRRIAHYEMWDLDPEKIHYGIPLASGCFMLFRTPLLKKLRGFSEKYFLYFEDYDLSMRTHQYGDIAYVPDVRILHYGGGATRKGLKHILLFVRSAITFFNQHGWKWW